MALKLFYSYSTKDEELRDELETHLSFLRRQGIIEEWHFRNIVAGRNFEDDIDKNLEAADVILLLVSADFSNSDYCSNREMKRALERQDLGEARVIPIIVRPCDWSGAPFANLEALPRDAKAVTTWGNRDEAWTDVAKGLRASVEEFIKQAPKSGKKGTRDRNSLKSDASITKVYPTTDRTELFPMIAGVSPGSAVALITCIALENPSEVREAITRLRDDFLHDPYVRRVIPSLEDLRKQGRDYQEDDPEVRGLVIDRLSTLPFEGYACFADRKFFESLDNRSIRAKLFGRLFYERLRAYRERQIVINVSAESDLAILEAQLLVEVSLREIREQSGIVFKRAPVVATEESTDGCHTVGSYVSAITLKKLESPDSLDARAFEKIRSKMRLIHDLANDIFYSRERQLP
jgi:TIR domain